MAELINLRRAKKAKARTKKAAKAESNRVLHGAPKAARDLARARAQKAAAQLAAHRLDKKES